VSVGERRGRTGATAHAEGCGEPLTPNPLSGSALPFGSPRERGLEEEVHHSGHREGTADTTRVWWEDKVLAESHAEDADAPRGCAWRSSAVLIGP